MYNDVVKTAKHKQHKCPLINDGAALQPETQTWLTLINTEQKLKLQIIYTCSKITEKNTWKIKSGVVLICG